MERLFREALEQRPEDRYGFVSSNCCGDADLLREVWALIEADARQDSFLDEPASGDRPREGLQFPARRRIGPYRLLRLLGSGGMSHVFMAIRADGQYIKRVAVKVIRRDQARKDLLRRFLTERQVLASLEHPNIAELYDGDVTEDGLPYFVMEYVDGVPIDRYCEPDEGRCLLVEDRIRLFRKVSAAVHYAHQNLVVHRDLKPANILITTEGDPKLLDFGIAKILTADPSSLRLDETATGVRPMTPHYASPEQVRGDTITTASDVYSLGVLLYRLLTGRLPYVFKTGGARELERVVCEQEPEKPSIAAGVSDRDTASRLGLRPRELQRLLAGDLDDIVLRALRKEPHERYASTEQLSEDLRRYLAGQPVRARRGTYSYRAGKFLRRHRLAVASCFLFLAMVLAFAAAMALQASRVAAERDRARIEYDKAQRVLDFIQGVFELADPDRARGETITVREVLDRGAERVERELRGQPEMQSTLMTTIGRVYASLGLYPEAEPLLETGLETLEAHLGRGHPGVAASRSELANLRVAQGDLEAAERLHREALETRRRHFGEEHPEVVESLSDLAVVLDDKARYSEAEGLLRMAITRLGKLRSEDDLDLSCALRRLGTVLHHRGEHEEAEEALLQALAIDRKVLGDEHPRIADDLRTLAAIYNARGDYGPALAGYREALDLQSKVLGEEHPSVATTLQEMAVVYSHIGDYEAAEPLYRQALIRQQRLLGERHPAVAWTLNDLAQVLRVRGELDAAEPLFLRALAIRRQALGEEHPEVAWTLASLAALAADRGDRETAISLLRQSLEIQRKSFDDEHPEMATDLFRLGALLLEGGEPGEAEPLLTSAVGIWRRTLSADHWYIAYGESGLGACWTALGRYAEAEPLLLDSYSILRTASGVPQRLVVSSLQRLSDLYRAWGKPAAAERYEALLAQPTSEP